MGEPVLLKKGSPASREGRHTEWEGYCARDAGWACGDRLRSAMRMAEW